MSRQYIAAGAMVDSFNAGESFKNYKKQIGKMEYLLASETLKYSSVLDVILGNCSMVKKSKGQKDENTLDVNDGVMRVMIYDLLFGLGKISGGGAVKRKIMEFEQPMKNALKSFMTKENASSHEDLLPLEVRTAAKLPKFVRVNEIKLGVQDGWDYLTKQGYDVIRRDDLIPSLLELHPSTKGIGNDAFVKEGNLIIQDKASCFTSQVLFDAWSADNCLGDFVDACAAPGNKTSHLAAQLIKRENDLALSNDIASNSSKKKAERKGSTPAAPAAPQAPSKIFAFDKNPTRCSLLQERMLQAGAGGTVHVNNEDFLGCDTLDPVYQQVTGLLVDPSCSGSGVVRGIDRIISKTSSKSKGDKAKDADRLQKLQSFQIQCIRKAMEFPQARYVAYSTCSVHTEENEEVVSTVLQGCRASTSTSTKTVPGGGGEDEGGGEECEWILAAPHRFGAWSRRGLPSSGLALAQSACLIRALPSDGMNGFFVALFQRNPSFDCSRVSRGGREKVQVQGQEAESSSSSSSSSSSGKSSSSSSSSSSNGHGYSSGSGSGGGSNNGNGNGSGSSNSNGNSSGSGGTDGSKKRKAKKDPTDATNESGNKASIASKFFGNKIFRVQKKKRK